MNVFNIWRAEIEAELAEEAERREAALQELSEAQAADREIAAALAEMQPALAALDVRIDAEQRVEMQGAAVLRQAPAPLAAAIILRLQELEATAKSARSRTIVAGHGVDQANASISDKRKALDQLDLLATTSAADEKVA
jgi:cell division FtsZ-interacting protein ZapD